MHKIKKMQIILKSTVLVFSVLVLYFSSIAQPGMMPTMTEKKNKEELFLDALRDNFIGRYDKSIPVLESLYRDDRGNHAVSFELARAYSGSDKKEEAERYIRAAIREDSGNGWYHLFLGNLLLEQARFTEAVESFEKLVELQPRIENNYKLLENAYRQSSRIHEIPGLYIKLKDQIGGSYPLYEKLIDAYREIGDLEKALTETELLIKSYPGRISPLKLKAEILMESNQLAEAEKVYDQILAVNPDDTEANLFKLGTSGGDDVNAYLRSLLPIIRNPNIPIDLKVKEIVPYIESLVETGDAELGAALSSVGEQLILSHPSEAKAHSLYGDVLFHLGKYEKATERYRRTIELNPRVFAVWEQVFYCLDQLEAYEELYETSDQALIRYPNSGQIFYYAAKAAFRTGRNRQARGLIEDGIIISGAAPVLNSHFYVLKATMNIAEGDIHSAKSDIERALEISGGKNPFAYEVLGEVSLKENNTELARESFRESIRLGNNSKQILEKLNAIQ
jgi:tetratricopeptide (TPR) repeat protein